MPNPFKVLGEGFLVYINYYIDRTIKERLDKYCEDVEQTNTMAVECILKKFLDEYEYGKIGK